MAPITHIATNVQNLYLKYAHCSARDPHPHALMPSFLKTTPFPQQETGTKLPMNKQTFKYPKQE